MIYVLKMFEKTPEKMVSVDTTTRSRSWSRGLSPMIVGPVKHPNGWTIRNVENAWQYSKVYGKHIRNGKVTDDYWYWAKEGFAKRRGVRYPMGKGRAPKFSIWGNSGELSYVEARKRIYIPVYANTVVKTEAFKQLWELAKQNNFHIALRDYDGYNHHALGMSFYDVIHDEKRKMGHAFVLAMLLEKYMLHTFTKGI